MNNTHIIADELNLPKPIVIKVLSLFAEGNTVPFVARYRKEITGGLDEVALRNIEERNTYLGELVERKETVIKTIIDQDKMSPELEKTINDCLSKTELEEIYLPYKPKRRTRATIAREKGLEPLAMKILEIDDGFDPVNSAIEGMDSFKNIESVEDALAGAGDIISEIISENSDYRNIVYTYMHDAGHYVSKVKKEYKEKNTKYNMYYDYHHTVNSISSHNMLGLRRAEDEGVITFTIEVPDEEILAKLKNSILGDKKNQSAEIVSEAIEDSYSRLMKTSIISRIRLENKDKADEEAIETFASNLNNLLLAPPGGGCPIVGIDPGFRTGCKIVALDNTGKLLDDAVIYPTEPRNDFKGSARILYDWFNRYKIELVAIGNGTGSRETGKFVHWALAQDEATEFKGKIKVVIVNESGASIYSASEVAAREFPDKDITVRGAVSIARRLQDPLAELVKIDPKSIGVGQYQHDVQQKKLKKKLDDVVEDCVNYVGVDVNTASKELLSYVAGISSSLAENIVSYRNQNGLFSSRDQFLKVKKLGPKAFEQCAGFMRIRNSANLLDNSAVHPESYYIVDMFAENLQEKPSKIIGCEELIDKLDPHLFVSAKAGLPTITDILEELKKPGRDPRKLFITAAFDESINEIEDLEPDMILEGSVTNVANFGAFVDIGVHQDGLVHISEISNKFVKDIKGHVSVGDIVKVKVLEVDVDRKRISLSMKHLSR
ncbi:transcriptional accessory protein [Candidatus Scalindua japonica]|uniref:Transcriptional accessory protein n=1 Tax=Candidatus Scalindua japonica TaxID=1284222 RepID=A0A286TWU6_9BACT|nr:Tex family protein [Candidatus Scalindua japonica]GAX60344.1 transcriptional accessory protein [Candidatus Scalindua japonica]